MFGGRGASGEPAAARPVVDGPEREALIAHMDQMIARGSMTEREYRQEYQRLFGSYPADKPGDEPSGG